LDKRLTNLGRNVSARVAAGVIAGAMTCVWAPGASAQAKPAKPAAEAKPAAGDAAASGKPDLAAAKKHYGEGDKKFKAGDFAGALVEFRAANDIKATPQVERYLGMCEDALGHFGAAIDWYDKFLAHVPEKLKDQGDEIKKREGEIKALPGKVHIDSVPVGANVSVDDKAQASPAPLDIELPAGQHKIKLSAGGRLPTEKAIDVGFASSQTVSASLDPDTTTPPPPPLAPVAAATPATSAPPPPPPPEPRSKVPAYITGGLAVVAAGVGTAFGVIALGDKSDFDKNPTSSKADNGDTHALIADMAFGVAITFGVTSAVLFLTNDEPPAAATASAEKRSRTAQTADAEPRTFKITPTPMVGPHTAGAGLLVQF
jgi:PEGA domain